MHEVNHLNQQQVLLVGPSTRAMASSAWRAGLKPICYDLFADTDLQDIAPVEVVPLSEYPHCLPERLKHHPPEVPVLYTGGLENHPSVYLALSEQRPVWGYLHPDPLQGDSIRNPEFLDSVARAKAIPRPRHERLCRDATRWLIKPRTGAGGRGIRFWNGEAVPDTHFLEQFLDGVSLAAVYCSDGFTTRCLGVTEQLVGCSFTHTTTPFAYSGSITMNENQSAYAWQGTAVRRSPLRINNQQNDLLFPELERIGASLAQSDQYLRGLFGIDYLLHDNVPYLLEVNPRYTASIEVLELTHGISTLHHHASAFACHLHPAQSPARCNALGKAIYFAPQHITFPPHGPWTVHPSDLWKMPEYADIPATASLIEQGQPVLTLFASGTDRNDVIHQLQQKALLLDQSWRD